ncbi:hypothetical protein Ate02nite_50850 [Paractinoplanes tereljensis]|uniref:Uncharacterized protein n=1 Tax=Paractinoplanes tereljensis TaxID=571912 RepID=A0A919TVH6_9ACTN|nr:hypothetical protein Ate02nite_50850 [Actinoplanes tereljensis]
MWQRGVAVPAAPPLLFVPVGVPVFAGPDGVPVSTGPAEALAADVGAAGAVVGVDVGVAVLCDEVVQPATNTAGTASRSSSGLIPP